MAILTATSTNEVQEVEWLHWLFVRDNRALSCDVDVRGDGLYTVSILPLWDSDAMVTQTFTKPGDALRRSSLNRRPGPSPCGCLPCRWNPSVKPSFASSRIAAGRNVAKRVVRGFTISQADSTVYTEVAETAASASIRVASLHICLPLNVRFMQA